MRIFKTKEFARIARRSRITDNQLFEAVTRLQAGHVDADLGGGVFKQRVARPGAGRSGGFRTLVAFRSEDLAVFLYAFAKSERSNIGRDELEHWRTIASTYFGLNSSALEELLLSDELKEVSI